MEQFSKTSHGDVQAEESEIQKPVPRANLIKDTFSVYFDELEH